MYGAEAHEHIKRKCETIFYLWCTCTTNLPVKYDVLPHTDYSWCCLIKKYSTYTGAVELVESDLLHAYTSCMSSHSTVYVFNV